MLRRRPTTTFGSGYSMTWLGQMSLVEPETRDLGQHLALQRNRGQHAVEGRKPIACDQDAPPVGQVVIVAHLAGVMVRQLGDRRIPQRAIEIGGEQSRIGHGVLAVREAA